jgi:hypothetical protein
MALEEARSDNGIVAVRFPDGVPTLDQVEAEAKKLGENGFKYTKTEQRDLVWTETQMMKGDVEHTWHDGNNHKLGVLLSAIIPLNWDTEFQGGWLNFEGWKHLPHRDNFAEWKGDPTLNNQPHWSNEVGSCIFLPCHIKWGLDRVYHGERKIRVISFFGEYNERIR